MNKRLRLKLKKLLPADSYKLGKPWRGYTVYLPVYKHDFTASLPQVILQKGVSLRASSYQECFEYTTFANAVANAQVKPINIKRTVL